MRTWQNISGVLYGETSDLASLLHRRAVILISWRLSLREDVPGLPARVDNEGGFRAVGTDGAAVMANELLDQR